MAYHPGKTIVSKIMQELRHNGQSISRDVGLPIYQIVQLIQGRISFDNDIAEKFSLAYPDAEMSAQDWMGLQAAYDADPETVVDPLDDAIKHPGWHVVDKIMRGYLADGRWMTPNSRELAVVLDATHDEILDLLQHNVALSAGMAEKLAAAFSHPGMSSDNWLQLQTDYDNREEQP